MIFWILGKRVKKRGNNRSRTANLQRFKKTNVTLFWLSHEENIFLPLISIFILFLSPNWLGNNIIMSVQVIKKLTPALREIRIHLCSKGSNSNGVRQFIDKYYLDLKTKNPNIPILVRECTGIEPKIWFRYQFGRETSASLNNLDADQIAGLLKDLDSR